MALEVFSETTAAVWVTVMVGLGTLFAIAFVFKAKSPVLLQREKAKGKEYLKLMGVIMKSMTEKATKAKAEGEAEPQDLPEAKRLFDLLWDDVAELRTTAYGIGRQEEALQFTEDLLKRAVAKELALATEATQGSGAPAEDSEQSKNKEVESGEKLKEKLDFCKEVKKRLGIGFVDDAQVKASQEVLRRAQAGPIKRKNFETLAGLIAPIIPHLLVCIPCTIIAEALMSVYFQIGRWQLVGDAAAAHDDALLVWCLVDLALGHLAIWAFEIVGNSFCSRAEGTFLQTIRCRVLKSLLLQDYEYFDKNAPGVLQERLNNDAEKLGSNCIQLPRQVLSHIGGMTLTLYQVWVVCPLNLFLLALAPLPIIAGVRYKIEKASRSFQSRGRKMAELAAAGTAEVLKEVKTVRQFANERNEASRFARGELARVQLGEKAGLIEVVGGRLNGVVVVAGLLFTMYIGAGLVKEGKITPGLLFDITIKLNFWAVDRFNRLVELSPRLRSCFEPLGRICELLEANPRIEQSGRLRSLTLTNRGALEAVLEKCDAVEDTCCGREAVILREDLPLEDGERPVPKGFSVQGYQDGVEERMLLGKRWMLEQNLSYPVTLFFSVKITPIRFRGEISFDNVSFKYPTDLRKPVLCGLSFKVEPHTKVALVGEAGCGKSSCMGLLQRLYDPGDGVIRIDGVDLRDYNINYLRTRVAVVDQRPIIFAATIRDNITYGMRRDVTDQEVIDVLHAASLWEGDNGIKCKPDQIFTRLGSGGIALSGGQMQRVSIARVMLRNPDVILLDEATSALDNKNEKVVQTALDKLAARGSSLVIAHRLTTIKDSDKIVVMRKGILAEEGTHEELLKIPIVREMNLEGEQDVVQGIYRFLWELQFNQEGAEDVPIKEALRELSCLCSDAGDDEQREGDLSGWGSPRSLPSPTQGASVTPPLGTADARRASHKLLSHQTLQSMMKLLEQDSTCVMEGGGPVPLSLQWGRSAPGRLQ